MTLATMLPSADTTTFSIPDLLLKSVEDGASDLHLSCNSLPKYRIDGDLIDMDVSFIVNEAWLMNEFAKLVTREKFTEYEEEWELDASYEIEGVSRFRMNFFQEVDGPAGVFRVIPNEIRSLDELQLPEVLREIAKKKTGLVLVTGPTGSGKSTTLAAMIDSINESSYEHIMTIEDPIEYVYESKLAHINQREVGKNTRSFNQALRRVLRQDPDVILIGELRDAETISIALKAAETGHLVFGTLHTQSAAKTINRILDSFSGNQLNQIRSQLADTLQAVVAQVLLKKNGGGRVAATEILVRTTSIAAQIRNDPAQINSTIHSGRNYGMHTLNQDLNRLLREGVISKEQAMEYLIEE